MTSPPAPDPFPADLLPDYRAMLVVDIKDFSGVPGRWHQDLSREVPELLGQTFAGSGWRDWSAAERFSATTGDGYVLGFEPWALPFLVHPFLENLQRELEFRNRVAPTGAGPADRPLRMRVSLHVGPVTDSGTNRLGDGNGDARIALHRLLDAAAVRHLLDDSSPRGTLVAAILSSRVFEDVVVGGYSVLDPAHFVRVSVEEKSYRGEAYVHVPRPTGGLLARGFRVPTAPAGSEIATARASAEQPTSPGGSGAHGRPDTSGPHDGEPDISRSRPAATWTVGRVDGGIINDNQGIANAGGGALASSTSGDSQAARGDINTAGRDQHRGPRTEQHTEHHGQGHLFSGQVDRSTFGDSTFSQSPPPARPRRRRPRDGEDGETHGDTE
ncbi:hypothetical protein [Frankia sp. ACN1ag]|uniref:hypothetical protein n=1 Tax=Frankia sp. ACN1ag TaxID=102891 RepID=UPI0006DC6EE3|nr:hypothetical protein [Frankia sp. ACN1ag]